MTKIPRLVKLFIADSVPNVAHYARQLPAIVRVDLTTLGSVANTHINLKSNY